MAAALVALGVVTAPPSGAGRPTSLAAGFTDTLVADVDQVTDIEPLPDGRLLLTQKPGLLRVLDGQDVRATPALDLRAVACSHSELGLISVAADPSFSANGHLYAFFTTQRDGRCVHRVSRFSMVGDVVRPQSERVLLDGIPAWTGGMHTGGDLLFGADGHLYVAVGDGFCDYDADSGCNALNDAGRDRHTLLGKLVRISRDGGVPADNPWTGAGSASCASGNAASGLRCREVYASGLRSPWKLAATADRQRIYLNDVGASHWEEVNEVVRGADYGWNLREGPCLTGSYTRCPADPRYTDPRHSYRHEPSGCTSITGGAFVPAGARWPAWAAGGYVYSDFVCGRIFLLRPDGTVRTLASGMTRGSAVSLAFVGRSLLYTTWLDGEVRAVRYTGAANRAPYAELAVDPDAGAVPLRTTLSGHGSYDVDGDGLTYLWAFGDGSSPAQTAVPSVQHSYAAGTWTATLRVRDSTGLVSAPATARIVSGDRPPVPRILSPGPAARFLVGQQFVLDGTADDPEDGALGADSLSWDVARIHSGHEHPYLTDARDGATFRAPEPEALGATRTSWLELRLTATDSAGTSRTVTQRLRPRLIDVRLRTVPAGGRVFVNGTGYATPVDLVGWAAGQLTLSAPAEMSTGAGTATFAGWSDGGARTHVTRPRADVTYTATYR